MEKNKPNLVVPLSKDFYTLVTKDSHMVSVLKNGHQIVSSLRMPHRIVNITPSGNADEWVVSQNHNGKSYVSIVSISKGTARIKRTVQI